mmetsp:Transcript_10167/g.46557  ORF Transcript_10167/g.46557 Transcript_10167/m.46557 type:complete len:211 (-) Transcript_10167:229-861(-)
MPMTCIGGCAAAFRSELAPLSGLARSARASSSSSSSSPSCLLGDDPASSPRAPAAACISLVSMSSTVLPRLLSWTMCSSSTTTHANSLIRSSHTSLVTRSFAFSGVATMSPPDPSRGGRAPPRPPKKPRTSIPSGLSIRVSSVDRSWQSDTNGRTMSASAAPPSGPPAINRRTTRRSDTRDLPPLVGAQYTRFRVCAITPGIARHSACHG